MKGIMSKHIVTSTVTAEVEENKVRVFPNEIDPAKLLPVEAASIHKDWFAPANSPSYQVAFPFQLPPGRKLWAVVWKNGKWVGDLYFENNGTQPMWHTYQSYYEYYALKPRFIFVESQWA